MPCPLKNNQNEFKNIHLKNIIWLAAAAAIPVMPAAAAPRGAAAHRGVRPLGSCRSYVPREKRASSEGDGGRSVCRRRLLPQHWPRPHTQAPGAGRHSTARRRTVVADDLVSPDRRLGHRGSDVIAFNHGPLDGIDQVWLCPKTPDKSGGGARPWTCDVFFEPVGREWRSSPPASEIRRPGGCGRAEARPPRGSATERGDGRSTRPR